MVGAHLHNLPFREGCAGSQWGVDGKGWGEEFGGRVRGGPECVQSAHCAVPG